MKHIYFRPDKIRLVPVSHGLKSGNTKGFFRRFAVFRRSRRKTSVIQGVLSRIFENKLARALLINFWKILTANNLSTCLRIVYFKAWTVKARHFLLPHFWVTETCKIHLHLIRPCFETRKKEDANACKLFPRVRWNIATHFSNIICSLSTNRRGLRIQRRRRGVYFKGLSNWICSLITNAIAILIFTRGYIHKFWGESLCKCITPA